jgi:hypothetical protein
MKRIYTYIFFLFILKISVATETDVADMKRQIEQEKDIKKKINLMIRLSNEFSDSDSVVFFNQISKIEEL